MTHEDYLNCERGKDLPSFVAVVSREADTLQALFELLLETYPANASWETAQDAARNEALRETIRDTLHDLGSLATDVSLS